MNLIIDQGNTAVKVALFKKQELVFFNTYSAEDFQQQLLKEIDFNEVQEVIIASVVTGAETHFSFLKNHIPHVVFASSTMPLPFLNKYATPQTLGVDRLALIAGAIRLFPNRNTLVISAGTCITFDVVTQRKEYLGGAIAPGIAMRLKAMHQFTSKLPLLERQDFDTEQFIGNTTESCMLSGVYNNVVREIEGVISQYDEKFADLAVILTGGNQKYLQERIKKPIFASSFVLLEGLNSILEYQKEMQHSINGQFKQYDE